MSLESLGTECHVYSAPAYVYCIHSRLDLISSAPSVRPAGLSGNFSSLAYCLLWLAWGCLRTQEEGSCGSALKLFSALAGTLGSDDTGSI